MPPLPPFIHLLASIATHGWDGGDDDSHDVDLDNPCTLRLRRWHAHRGMTDDLVASETSASFLASCTSPPLTIDRAFQGELHPYHSEYGSSIAQQSRSLARGDVMEFHGQKRDLGFPPPPRLKTPLPIYLPASTLAKIVSGLTRCETPDQRTYHTSVHEKNPSCSPSYIRHAVGRYLVLQAPQLIVHPTSRPRMSNIVCPRSPFSCYWRHSQRTA